jgi:HEXXH motif-containing protein
MIPDRHRIPEKVFLALAAGSGGAQAIGHLQAAQYSKRLLLLRGIRDEVIARRHPAEGPVRQAFSVLSQVQDVDAETADLVIRYPSVGAWAWTCLRCLNTEHEAEADPGWFGAIAAAAAIRSGFRCALRVPVRHGFVMLPSLGRAALPGETSAMVRCGADGVELAGTHMRVRLPSVPHHDAPGWQALPRLYAAYQGAGVRLLLDELDSHRLPGAAVREDPLGPTELTRWGDCLRRAWRLLVRQHWTTSEEVAAAITALVPMAAPPGRHASATPFLATGAVGLSAPPDDEHHLAVTLAHEIQHTKLAALTDVIELTLPDDGRRFYAPWRDDPRPIHGLLHGTYAHLGIAGYWRRQRHLEEGESARRAHREFVRWRDASVESARTLSRSGRLTAAGERFVAEMSRTLVGWQNETVPPEVMAEARREAEDHNVRWRREHGDGDR